MGRPVRKPPTERGRQVLAWLEERGLSLTAAAEVAGVTPPTIGRVVHARTLDELPVGTLRRLVSRLQLPLELLVPELALALSLGRDRRSTPPR